MWGGPPGLQAESHLGFPKQIKTKAEMTLGLQA